ncbi:serine/threonine-protein kinase STY8-like [Homarus americanus]|uniref:Serine/threonine-protein kinase n=1 Tax=Homarus americanus TaxID=6706 RepID=A0A8J5MQB5_HOMAM|nr:serine/threonine-protein kinase STY8-like [Homarus americanus]KAG7159785.1 serine/threonine-protein kinase [Homarus americanus]
MEPLFILRESYSHIWKGVTFPPKHLMQIDNKISKKLLYKILIKNDLENLRRVRAVGQGTSGVVHLIEYKNEHVVLKTFKNDKPKTFRREANKHFILDGAGGAPVIYCICSTPPALVMSYTGIAFEKLYFTWSEKQLVCYLIKLAEALEEIHAKGVIHNDLKVNNITVLDEEVHVIDFGLSTMAGEVFPFIPAKRCNWMAPELSNGQPTSPASDVFSFSTIIGTVV